MDFIGCNRIKAVGLCQKQKMVKEICQEKGISSARACKIINIERSSFYYQSARDYSQIEERLLYYAEKLPARGCPEYNKRIQRDGYLWNHKRIERVYNKLNMNKRKRKIKHRITNLEKQVLLQTISPNTTRSMDFMHDVLEESRKVRMFNVPCGL